MSFDLNAVNAIRPTQVPVERPTPRTGATTGAFADALKTADANVDATVDAIPASPPADVMHEVLAAQRAIHEMHEQGRTLHFSMDSGRVKILLQDLDGNTLREVPPSRAVDAESWKRLG